MYSALIEKLYKVFSNYLPGVKLTGCYCELCLTEDYNLFLQSTPLRLLQSKDLVGYLSAAGILENNCCDFKYFLPRMLEIMLVMHDNSKDFDFYFWTVLGRANHYTWPISEQELLRAFANAYLTKPAFSNDESNGKFALLDLTEADLVRYL